MAVTKTTTITSLAGTLVIDFQANATSEDNVTGNSSGAFYLIDIDNTANASTFAYVKIRDASSATPNHASNGIPIRLSILTRKYCEEKRNRRGRGTG